jgi:hypothetical protein
MRQFGASGWVVVAVRAFASYLAALVVILMWMTMTSTDPRGEFAALNREVAAYAGLMLGLPTVALTLLRQRARRRVFPAARMCAGDADGWIFADCVVTLRIALTGTGQAETPMPVRRESM